MTKRKSTTAKATAAAKATDAAYGIDCPACQATAGEVCVTPEAVGLDEPHGSRVAAAKPAKPRKLTAKERVTSGQAAVREGMADIMAGEATSATVLAAVAEIEPAVLPENDGDGLATGDGAEKRCPGVPQLAKPHQAPATAEAFTVKVSRPDGLSRRCKACQKLDRDRRRAAKPAAKPTKGERVAASLHPAAKPVQRVKDTSAKVQVKRAKKPTAAQLRKAELDGEAAANAA